MIDKRLKRYHYSPRGWLDGQGPDPDSDEGLLSRYPIIPYPAIRRYRQVGRCGFEPIVDIITLKMIDEELLCGPKPPYEAMKSMPIRECGEKMISVFNISPRITSNMIEQRMGLQGISEPLLVVSIFLLFFKSFNTWKSSFFDKLQHSATAG